MRFFLCQIATFICIFYFHSEAISQRCFSDEKMQPILEQNEAYRNDLDAVQKHLKSNPKNRSQQVVIIIPVHVILIHAPGEAIGQGDNLSVEHVLSQIDVLNEDFRRTNADAVNTPPEFATEDHMIEFCMASVDPNGEATDGITRYPTTEIFDDNEFDIKQETGWPRENYLNIWVDPELDALGYAYLPGINNLPTAVLDGIVCRTAAFGGPGFATSNAYGLGRTCTHEAGHYLGLRHVWRSDGCGQDDGFEDTPLQDDENFGCPTHPSPSCTNNGDMFMNYMDYVDDDCMNAFSTEQGQYMQLILNNSRSSLLSAANTFCTEVIEILTADIEQINNVTCFDGEDGNIILTATGGIAPYLYSIDGINFFTTNEFLDLPAGEYTAIIEDDAGTQVELLFEIIQPEIIEIELINELLPSCFGDANAEIELSVFGGTEPFEYSLNGSFVNGLYLTELTADVYQFQVMDDQGCSAEYIFEVFDPEPMSFAQESFLGLGCHGEPGQIIVEATGGQGDITYSINGGSFNLLGEFYDLVAGDYAVIAQDENGCVIESSINIADYEEISLVVDEILHVSCAGISDGQILVLGGGGNGALSYSVNEVDFQSSEQFSGLQSGNYTIQAMDANGCIQSIFAQITSPDNIDVVTQVSNLSCFEENDGVIYLSATGGTGDFIYSIDGITFDSTSLFSDLGAGQYQIVCEDANGCLYTEEIELFQPEALVVDQLLETMANCPGERTASIQFDIYGGTLPYMVTSPGLIGIELNSHSFIIDNLDPGAYSFSIVDAHGCATEVNASINTLADFMPQNLSIVAQTNGALGKIEFNLNGGSPPYQFSIDGSTFQANALFENLIAGSYTISATDANGCAYSLDVTVPDNTTTSIDNTWINNIDIRPNPVSDILSILVPEEHGGTTHIKIININGQVALEETTTQTALQINVNRFTSGLYILQISTENEMGLRKIMVSHQK